MKRDQKKEIIDNLVDVIGNNSYFYLADSSGLTVAEVNELRRICFNRGVQFTVVKNSLVEKALDAQEGDYEEVKSLLKGPTSLMVSETANLPAKILKEFRKAHKKPLLKGAYIDAAVFVGDDKLDELTKLKSKEELIGEIIGLLQSPMMNLISALKSGEQTIAGLVKTLENKEQ